MKISKTIDNILKGLLATMVITTTSTQYKACGYVVYERNQVDTVQQILPQPYDKKPEYQPEEKLYPWQKKPGKYEI